MRTPVSPIPPRRPRATRHPLPASAPAARRSATITKDPNAPTLLEFVVDWLGLEVSVYQRSLLKVIDGAPRLTGEEFDAFKLATKRTRYVSRRYLMITVIAGARSGKDSRLAVPLLLYHALFVDHRATKGETLIFPLLAQDRLGSDTAFNYAVGYLRGHPVLNAMVEEYLSNEIRLVGGGVIRCYPATAAAVSGVSAPCGIMDEVGFLPRTGRDSDIEIEASLFTRMASFPNKQLIKISTPRTPDGILWRDSQRWGQDDERMLVWLAPTAAMNPSIDLSAYSELMDPARFAREFEAQFSDAVEAFLSLSLVERAVAPGIWEREPQLTIGSYRVAIDAAAGGADDFTCAVVHREYGQDDQPRVIHDALRGWKTGERGTPLDVVLEEVAALAKRYRENKIYGDRYGGSEKYGLIATALRKHGIMYVSPRRADEEGKLTDQYADKSVLYSQLQLLFLAGRIEILDRPDTPLVRQLTLLQRTPGPQRDRIDHPKGGHDDFSTALACAAYVCSTGSGLPSPMAGTPLALGMAGRMGGGPPGGQAARYPGQVAGQAAIVSRYYGGWR
jgi:hypothetical protein